MRDTGGSGALHWPSDNGPAGDVGNPGVLSASQAATLFLTGMPEDVPAGATKVLVVERLFGDRHAGVQKAMTAAARRRGRNGGDGGGGDDVWSQLGMTSLPRVVRLWLMDLVITHGWHVKLSPNRKESERFAAVLKVKAGQVAGGGGASDSDDEDSSDDDEVIDLTTRR